MPVLIPFLVNFCEWSGLGEVLFQLNCLGTYELREHGSPNLSAVLVSSPTLFL